MAQYWLSIILLFALTTASAIVILCAYYFLLLPAVLSMGSIGIGTIILLSAGGMFLGIIPAIVAFPYNIGLQVRRFHDVGLTGWLIIVLATVGGIANFFFPPFGSSVLTHAPNPAGIVLAAILFFVGLAFVCWPGAKATNSYGDPTRYPSLWSAIRGKNDLSAGPVPVLMLMALSVGVALIIAVGAVVFVTKTAPAATATPSPSEGDLGLMESTTSASAQGTTVAATFPSERTMSIVTKAVVPAAGSITAGAKVQVAQITLTNTTAEAVDLQAIWYRKTGTSADDALGMVYINDGDGAFGTNYWYDRKKAQDGMVYINQPEMFLLQPGQSRSYTISIALSPDAGSEVGKTVGLTVVGFSNPITVSGMPVTGASYTIR